MAWPTHSSTDTDGDQSLPQAPNVSPSLWAWIPQWLSAHLQKVRFPICQDVPFRILLTLWYCTLFHTTWVLPEIKSIHKQARSFLPDETSAHYSIYLVKLKQSVPFRKRLWICGITRGIKKLLLTTRNSLHSHLIFLSGVNNTVVQSCKPFAFHSSLYNPPL